MKYQLITTIGPAKNPGDAIIRIGVQNVIRANDPEAEFVLTCKETDPHLVEADRYVWCGMPLLWHYRDMNTRTISWWQFLMDFCKQPQAEIWGAGSCVGSEYDPDLIRSMAKDITCKVTVRDHLLSELTGWPLARCPAFYAIQSPGNKSRLLCNWHPLGGHYPYCNPQEWDVWWKMKEAYMIQAANPDTWEYVAHSQEEIEHGQALGYRTVHSGTAEELLAIYRDAKAFVGHRIHGAIACRSAGCDDVKCIGWESRMFSVSHPGEPKMWFYPSEL